MRRYSFDSFEPLRPDFLIWATIAFACGIGVNLNLRFEPEFSVYLGLFITGLIMLINLMRKQSIITLSLSLLLIVLTGFSYMGLRTNYVQQPVLNFHYYGSVQGRIIAIDKSSKNRPRITLDQVRLEKTDPAKTPKYLRVSLHYPSPFTTPKPGMQVMITASMSPPSPPS